MIKYPTCGSRQTKKMTEILYEITAVNVSGEGIIMCQVLWPDHLATLSRPSIFPS